MESCGVGTLVVLVTRNPEIGPITYLAKTYLQRRAMRPGGTLLLIENVVDGQRPAGAIELLMLVIGGRERTGADFRSPLAATGFAITRIVAAEGILVIECHLV